MKSDQRKMIPIGAGKTKVWASEPYEPSLLEVSDLVGREREIRLITAAWMGGANSLPLAPLLVGEPGVGKNRLVYELARQSGRDLFIMQGHEDLTAEDFACAVRFSDNGKGGMEYFISPLTTAMLQGGICFIDEIGKIRPRALALLVSVLDERRYIDSTLLGERVYAAPGFRFIAATNNGEINTLPEFIRSRMRPVINVDFSPKKEINTIIAQQFNGLQSHLEELLDTFWNLWGECGDAGKYPTPRDAIHLFSLASSLSDMDNNTTPAKCNSSQKYPALSCKQESGTFGLQPYHLKDAFKELYAEGAN